jgi:hypothetical protein
MLLDEPRTSYKWYGVLALGLSIGSFNVARNGYQESADALDKADAAYKRYKAAATADDATKYHNLTVHYRREAVAFESTANAAVFLGVIFAATGVWSFFADGDKTPLLISYDRVGLQYRF